MGVMKSCIEAMNARFELQEAQMAQVRLQMDMLVGHMINHLTH